MPSRLIFILSIIYILFLFSCGDNYGSFSEETLAQLPAKIDFNYHIKPIISDHCFACHGPDVNKVEAGLRLDIEESAFALLESGKHAIVQGNPSKSELFHRIVSLDSDYQMPPPDENLELTDYEKALLVKWIDQGAEYKAHWSFIPPRKAKLPETSEKNWIRNPIDHFVLARLEQDTLAPSKEADKTTLLRRVNFDVIGLPPTLEEIDQFLADTSADAYEKVVDRLLSSPHYGERMAMDWLDVARYADSHGYHADGYRMMWPWRDWVINAFNENLPFDQFVSWQLAGDLVPNATQDQVLATGFHRNNPINSESGIVPEEYRLENVFDRTNTTAKAFLGLTMECARCHDHKFDPLSQKEYFQFAAFFNNVDELGMIGNDGNTAPTMPLMTKEAESHIHFLRSKIEKKKKEKETYIQQINPTQIKEKVKIDPDYLTKGLKGYYPLDKISSKMKTPNMANIKKEATFRSDSLEKVDGWKGAAVRYDSEYEFLTLDETADFERTNKFSIGAAVYPEIREEFSVIIGNSGGKNNHWRGHEMFLDEKNCVNVRLTHGLPDHCLYVTTYDSIPVNEWSHLMFTYDGSSKAAGIKVYINGKLASTETHYDYLNKSIRTIDDTLNVESRRLRVGRSYKGALDIGLFQGVIDEIRVYDRMLSGLEVAGIWGNEFWKNNAPLSETEENLLIDYYLEQQDDSLQKIEGDLFALREKEHAIIDTIPEVMVMREMNPPRKTYVLDRGVYDAPTEEVSMGLPTSLASHSSALISNRIGLANWLNSPDNPLMARVIVNRYWHMFFGRGLVNTLEDFGNQGNLPTHPELLDWLAVEFQQSGWDVKALFKLILTSATYRQSSVADAELMEIDPQNELMARGPSHRLSAEMVRDNALVASGLFVNKIGGPSVKTYQPQGLWNKTHFSRILFNYQPDKGEKLYRRSMYTFIRRTAPPPTMTVFDAPDRSACIVRRQKTSTPLQALLLMNEPQLLEAARILAERAIKEGGEDIESQLNYAFRLLTSREMTQKEIELMKELYDQEYTKYVNDHPGAIELLSVGDYPRDESLELPKVAGMSVVVNMMMNFDEVYTKR